MKIEILKSNHNAVNPGEVFENAVADVAQGNEGFVVRKNNLQIFFLNEEVRVLGEQPREEIPIAKRERLPDTRNATNHKFYIGEEIEGYINLGFFPDGRLGEVFVEMQKEGSTLGGMADAFAICFSIALQYGTPVEDLVRKFAYTRFEPSGKTHNPQIPEAYSVIDYIARYIGHLCIPNYGKPT